MVATGTSVPEQNPAYRPTHHHHGLATVTLKSFKYANYFENDLAAFRCIIRLDGALVDTGAVKTFVDTT